MPIGPRLFPTRPAIHSTYYTYYVKRHQPNKKHQFMSIFFQQRFFCVFIFPRRSVFHNSRSAGRVALVDLPFFLYTAAAVIYIGSESKCDYYTQSSIIMNLYRNSIPIELKLKKPGKGTVETFSQLNCAKPFDFTSTPLSRLDRASQAPMSCRCWWWQQQYVHQP